MQNQPENECCPWHFGSEWYGHDCVLDADHEPPHVCACTLRFQDDGTEVEADAETVAPANPTKLGLIPVIEVVPKGHLTIPNFDDVDAKVVALEWAIPNPPRTMRELLDYLANHNGLPPITQVLASLGAALVVEAVRNNPPTVPTINDTEARLTVRRIVTGMRPDAKDALAAFDPRLVDFASQQDTPEE